MSSATHVFLLVTSGHQVLTLEQGTLTLPRATTADRADLPALLAANLDGRVSRFRLLHHGPRNAHLWSALVHGHAPEAWSWRGRPLTPVPVTELPDSALTPVWARTVLTRAGQGAPGLLNHLIGWRAARL